MSIDHFLMRRKRFNKECPICYEDKELYEFDCGDIEHCFCFECYKLMDKCPSCNIPKNPYYLDLFPREEKDLESEDMYYKFRIIFYIIMFFFFISNISIFTKRFNIIIDIAISIIILGGIIILFIRHSE